MTVLDATLAPKGRADFVLRDAHASLLAMEGDVTPQGETAVRAGHFVLFEEGGARVTVEASSDARLLVLAGEPIGEPVVQHGPFAMTTEQEIREAYADFRSGAFGTLAD